MSERKKVRLYVKLGGNGEYFIAEVVGLDLGGKFVGKRGFLDDLLGGKLPTAYFNLLPDKPQFVSKAGFA